VEPLKLKLLLSVHVQQKVYTTDQLAPLAVIVATVVQLGSFSRILVDDKPIESTASNLLRLKKLSINIPTK
jgi:hypothetical protein